MSLDGAGATVPAERGAAALDEKPEHASVQEALKSENIQ